MPEIVLRSEDVNRRLAAPFVAVVVAAAGLVAAVVSSPPAAASSVSVKVVGNQLVNAAGRPLRLLGVDRSGTEYACAQGWGIFDGPSDQASIAAMGAWHVNAVRVPLNEDCWLGINGVNPLFSGAAYRDAVVAYVGRLNTAGLIAVLDLHWSAPGGLLAAGQQVMADADHSPAFWSSVGGTFKAISGVVFDLYNEPHDINWSCWRNGCTTSAGWQAAGMQALLNALRSSGAAQPALAGGVNWAGDLSEWLTWRPSDPAGQLGASAHIYNFSQCNTVSCWATQIAPVAASVPVVTGEMGENDCAHGFVDSYMSWADTAGVGYLGWSWNTTSCGAGPALITAYTGTPTAFGAGLQSHLATFATPAVPAAGVTVSRPLSVDADTISPGATLHAAATLTNTSTAAISLQNLAIAGRPPGGTNPGGPYDDLASTGPVTIQAGGVYTVQGSRTFTSSDPLGSWYSYLTWQDPAGGWHDQSPTVGFQVVSPATTRPSVVIGTAAADGGTGTWWAADDLHITLTQAVASLRVDLHVARTTGLTYLGMWSTLPAGTAALTHTDDPTEVVYTYSVAPPGGMPAGSYTLSGTMTLTGQAHPTQSDTWAATTTGPASTTNGSVLS